jgi:hypothetical protein
MVDRLTTFIDDRCRLSEAIPPGTTGHDTSEVNSPIEGV